MRLQGHKGNVATAAFSRNGRLLATASDDKTARLWGAKTGSMRASLRGHAGAVTSLAFSPDDRRLLTRGSEGRIRVWDTDTGAEVLTIGSDRAPIDQAVFHPSGQQIITWSSNKRTGGAAIWGVSVGELQANRRRSQEMRERWDRTIDGWLASGMDSAETELAKSKLSMTAEEYRQAANLLLIRCVARTSKQAPTNLKSR
jgi:WD40 repeat protein